MSESRIWTYAPAVIVSYLAGLSGVTHVSGGIRGTSWSQPKKKGMEYRSFDSAGRTRCLVDTKISSRIEKKNTKCFNETISQVWLKKRLLLTGPSGKLVANVNHKCVRHVWRVNPFQCRNQKFWSDRMVKKKKKRSLGATHIDLCDFALAKPTGHHPALE